MGRKALFLLVEDAREENQRAALVVVVLPSQF